MSRWEYLHYETTEFVKPRVARPVAPFDRFGEEGWELVAVTSDGCHFFFKRRLPDGEQT